MQWPGWTQHCQTINKQTVDRLDKLYRTKLNLKYQVPNTVASHNSLLNSCNCSAQFAEHSDVLCSLLRKEAMSWKASLTKLHANKRCMTMTRLARTMPLAFQIGGDLLSSLLPRLWIWPWLQSVLANQHEMFAIDCLTGPETTKASIASVDALSFVNRTPIPSQQLRNCATVQPERSSIETEYHQLIHNPALP